MNLLNTTRSCNQTSLIYCDMFGATFGRKSWGLFRAIIKFAPRSINSPIPRWLAEIHLWSTKWRSWFQLRYCWNMFHDHSGQPHNSINWFVFTFDWCWIIVVNCYSSVPRFLRPTSRNIQHCWLAAVNIKWRRFTDSTVTYLFLEELWHYRDSDLECHKQGRGQRHRDR
jgi:hypothetical protein